MKIDFEKVSNIEIFIIAIAVLCWFRGMYRMMDTFINDTIINNVVMILFALATLFIIDGDLSALGNSKKGNIPDKSKSLKNK